MMILAPLRSTKRLMGLDPDEENCGRPRCGVAEAHEWHAKLNIRF